MFNQQHVWNIEEKGNEKFIPFFNTIVLDCVLDKKYEQKFISKKN